MILRDEKLYRELILNQNSMFSIQILLISIVKSLELTVIIICIQNARWVEVILFYHNTLN